jgi:hypothetical protein
MKTETNHRTNCCPRSRRDRAGAPDPPVPPPATSAAQERRPRWAILSVASESSREEVEGRSCGPLFCNFTIAFVTSRSRAQTGPLRRNAACNSIIAPTSPSLLASHTAMQFPPHRLDRATNLRHRCRQRGFRNAEFLRPVSDFVLVAMPQYVRIRS